MQIAYYLIIHLVLVYVTTRFLVLPAIKDWKRDNLIKKNGIKTNGKIVDFEASNLDNQVYYSPIIEFTDEQGLIHQFTSKVGRPEKHNLGKTVRLYYLKDDVGRLSTRSANFDVSIIMRIFIGVMAFAVGTFFLLQQINAI